MTKMLSIHNTGDIGTKFEWGLEAFAPDLSISPAHGFLPPHSELRFELTFHPARVSRDIRYGGLRCRVEGASDLLLSVSGECVPQPESDVETVSFDARVREEVSKKVSLGKNDSTTPWVLTPVINNEYWKASTPSVTVAPGATGEYTLLYKPLSMTAGGGGAAAGAAAAAAGGAKKGGAPPAKGAAPAAAAGAGAGAGAGSGSDGDLERKQDELYRRPARHEGTLFFALPNGRALLYKLVGSAAAPAAAGNVTHTTPAKQNLLFTLPVTNWLKTTQRFSVTWDDTPVSTSLRGAKSLDVPAQVCSRADRCAAHVCARAELCTRTSGSCVCPSRCLIVLVWLCDVQGTREYKMTFYAYKQCKATTAVKFTNDATGEYVVFNVEVNVTAPGRVDVISMESVVRQVAQHTITIINPLGEDKIVFAPPKCTHRGVRVTQLGDVTGRPEGNFKVEYLPLVPTATPDETELVLTSEQLGVYTYTLRLTATAAAAEHAQRFETDLGNAHRQTVRFRHFLPTPATYSVAVSNPECFQVPATVNAPASADWSGVEVALEVVFEPESMGAVKSELRVSSADGGAYTWPLYGTAIAPRPRGPFNVPRATGVSIDVKNVLREDMDFAVATDNAAFAVAAASVRIGGKKSAAVAVKFTPPTEAGAATTGKLIVTCPALPSLPPWVFYISGV
jgi:hydrocephalus-inducing protein